MEKRRSERKRVSLEAGIATNGAVSAGFIEDICEHGLHIITASRKSNVSFVPETILELKVPENSGSKASLHCEVRWVHINKTPIHGLTYRMGMEIMTAPSEYKKFLNTLE